MDHGKEFKKYATKHLGINSLRVEEYEKIVSQHAGGIYGLTPNIIEERQMNASVIDIMGQLLFLESANPNRDIQIYINSPGGSVYAGLAIYDTMQYISSDVATICTGMAASMGAVLMCAGEKGKRTALPHSRIMIHQPLGGANGQASDIEITYKEISKLKKELYDIIAHHSGQPYDKVEKDSDRDYWMIADEAKEYGMIDEVLSRRAK